mgnify:CR=1 FL=1
MKRRKTPYNIVLAIGGLNGFVSTQVQNSTFVLRLKFSAKIPAHRQYANRYVSFYFRTMKSFIQYLFLTVFIIGCTNHRKNDSLKVTDDEIYVFVKMVLKDLEKTQKLEGTQDYYLQDELETPSFVYDNPNFKLDKYFQKNDLDFIQKQIGERKDFLLIQDSIKSKRIISKKIIDSFNNDRKDNIDRKSHFLKNYIKKYGNNFYDKLSLPIFSKDKKTVLIDISSFSGGRTIIYRKENNKWKSDIIVGWTG